MTVFVVPGDLADPAAVSGGNVYDRRVTDLLGLHLVPVAGEWPTPDVAARRSLGCVLTELPDGATVLFDGLVACGVPEVLAPQANRLGMVVLVHLPLGDEPGAAPELTGRERAVLRMAAAVVVTSEWAATRLADIHGIGTGRAALPLPAETAGPAAEVAPSRSASAGNRDSVVPGPRVFVAPPGVEPAPVTEASAAGGRLVSVGSVTPRKGHDVLVDALATIAGLDWTCTIVGPLTRCPAHVAAVAASVARQGLADRVRCTGPSADLDAVYAADLLVLPSRAETYGMVVAEALARAVPVVASDVGGVAQALGRAPDGTRPGLLVPPGDPTALAEALRRWLTDPELRATARKAALARRATLNDWEVTAACLAPALHR